MQYNTLKYMITITYINRTNTNTMTHVVNRNRTTTFLLTVSCPVKSKLHRELGTIKVYQH